ncbi:hypothetical protein V1264_008545 [Littorina saxatilis]
MEDNPSKLLKTIADDLDIPRTTLSSIKKDKVKIKQQYNSGEQKASRFRIRGSKYDDIDCALLQWFTEQRSSNVPLSGPLLKSKAEKLAREQGLADWTCSDGWLSRFKSRHNIVSKTVCGERGDVDEQLTDDWVEDVLKPTLRRYDPKDVFNADEMGLFWRLLPNKTLAFKHEKCHGGKKSKDRITVMVCASMDGEKVPLLAIGKFKNPRCFKGIKHLPIKYAANKKAWMTSAVFEEWLLSFDRTMDRQNRKVLLVIDNCPAHITANLSLNATELLFLPPCATAKLQPCDQGVIQNLKVFFRNTTLMKLVNHIDAGLPATDFKISLLDAVSELKMAWDKVTSTTIKNCFRKASFTRSEEPEECNNTSDPPIVENLVSEPILARLFKEWNISPQDYISVDDEVITSGPEKAMTDTVAPPGPLPTEPSQLSDSDDDSGESEEPVKQTEVLESVHKISMFLMQTGANDTLSGVFCDLRTALEKHMTHLRKQKKMTDYFLTSRSQKAQNVDGKEEKLVNQKEKISPHTTSEKRKGEEKREERLEEDIFSMDRTQKAQNVGRFEEKVLQKEKRASDTTSEKRQGEEKREERLEEDIFSMDRTQKAQNVGRFEEKVLQKEKRASDTTSEKRQGEEKREERLEEDIFSVDRTQKAQNVGRFEEKVLQKEKRASDTTSEKRQGEEKREERLEEDIFSMDRTQKAQNVGRENEDDVVISGFADRPPLSFKPTNNAWCEMQCNRLSLPEHIPLPQRQDKSKLGKPLEVDKIIGDGNCLYRSISFEVCGTQNFHGDIRALIVDFMLKHPKKFSGYVGRDLGEYVVRNTLPLKSWGTDAEIFAAATLFQTTIVVFTAESSTSRDWIPHHPLFKIPGVEQSPQSMYFRNLCGHYERVVRVE